MRVWLLLAITLAAPANAYTDLAGTTVSAPLTPGSLQVAPLPAPKNLRVTRD